MLPAELDIGIGTLETPITTLPGTLPPPGTQRLPGSLPLIASSPEAIFYNKTPREEENPLILRLSSITRDNVDLASPPIQLVTELQEIFTKPVEINQDLNNGRNPICEPERPTRSVEAARQIYQLTQDLVSRRVIVGEKGFFLHTGTTIRDDKWAIATLPEGFQVPRPAYAYTLNGAASELERRQFPHLPGSDHELRHEKFVMFFAVNWDRLASLFYDGPGLGDASLRRYIEVNFNDIEIKAGTIAPAKQVGMIDFIGELPDGQLVTVEFRNPGNRKTRQVARQTRGLMEILRQHNGDQIPQISQFLGVYDEIEDYATIKLLPRREQFLPYMHDIYDTAAA